MVQASLKLLSDFVALIDSECERWCVQQSNTAQTLQYIDFLTSLRVQISSLSQPCERRLGSEAIAPARLTQQHTEVD